jgi:hypothetical protein
VTAEIAILNKSAVALAADSAVTIQAQSGQKIYNTVNKLFGLSKYHPVGVMIYGSADLTGVPWETIIKLFRRHLGRRSRPRLEDYAEELKKFLTGNTTLFPATAQAQALRSRVMSGLVPLISQARNRAKARKEPVEQTLEAMCRLGQKRLDEYPFLVGYGPADVEAILDRHADTLRDVWDNAVADLPLSPELTSVIKRVVALFLCKAHDDGERCGIVIAGFGEEDVFPALVSFHAHYVSEDRLLVSDENTSRVTFEDLGWVIPFAQKELVSAFMEGIDPSHKRYVATAVRELLVEEYPKLVAESFSTVTGLDSVALKDKLAEVGAGAFEAFEARTQEHRNEHYVQPITWAVSFLPKDELAALAESLVNLTSLKKRVTMDPETVGGPVDVVVISKGDGLVWMKRKQYFRPELNPHFFTNYFREVKDGE